MRYANRESAVSGLSRGAARALDQTLEAARVIGWRKAVAPQANTLSAVVGKYGRFLGCTNFPDCGYTRDIRRQRPKGNATGSSALKNVSTLMLTGLSLSNVHVCSGPPMKRSVDHQTSGPNVSAGASYAGVKSAATWAPIASAST